MNTTDAILKVLRNNNNGLSAASIYKLVNSADLDVIRVLLSQMRNNGLVKKHGKTMCDECGSKRIFFTIAEQGRIKINALY
jgi:Fe2+ or Zn2+ uptake regulation protein